MNKEIQLKEKYGSFWELKWDCDKHEYFMMSVPNSPYIRVEGTMEEHEIHDEHCIMYKIEEGGALTRYHGEEKQLQIAKELAKHINPEKLMLHVLSAYNPGELEDLFERVIKKKGKITEGPGCYALNVGGNRGRPFGLMVAP